MTERDGQKDFDFWFGSWKVHNRRLRERLKASSSWEEFEARRTESPSLVGAYVRLEGFS